MKIAFYIIMFCLSFDLSFSNTLRGIVVNEDDGLPIEFASVFVSQTTIGTTTGYDGSFTLDVKLHGFYRLAITHICFQTYTIDINSIDEKQLLIIKLKKAYQQIEEVKIVPHIWTEDYYKLFYDGFIGHSNNSDECIIENPKSINFIGSKKGHLKAVSDSNIIINNKGLGYIINYKLDNFELFYSIDTTFLGIDSIENSMTEFHQKNKKYDRSRYFVEFTEDYLKYSGEPEFIDKINQSKNPKEIIQNRANAYYGSPMHFFRSLYTDSLEENGFVINKIKTTKTIKQINPPIKIHSILIDSIREIKCLKEHLDSAVMVKYVKYGEPRKYIRNSNNYKRLTLTKGQQTSLIEFYDAKFTEEGIAKGYTKYNGYMNWLRIAELLPFDFNEQTIKSQK
jgi:hypothetical protein